MNLDQKRAYECLAEFWRTKPVHLRGSIRAGVFRWAARHLGIAASEFSLDDLTEEDHRRIIELCGMAKLGLTDKPKVGNTHKLTPIDQKQAAKRRKANRKVKKAASRQKRF